METGWPAQYAARQRQCPLDSALSDHSPQLAHHAGMSVTHLFHRQTKFDRALIETLSFDPSVVNHHVTGFRYRRGA